MTSQAPTQRNPSKPTTRLTLEAITHEGTKSEQKQVSNLVPIETAAGPTSARPIACPINGGFNGEVRTIAQNATAIYVGGSFTTYQGAPANRVAKIEGKIQTGDIIGIVSHDGRLYGTSHVGLALRTSDGVLHFMHASAPHNYGKVVVDSRLSTYLNTYRSDSGILVARPLR